MNNSTLAVFDLDNTLLTGDSDVLWCEFLVAQGLQPPDQLALNARMDAGYRAGTVSVADFSQFHVGTLGRRSPGFWAPWLQRFLQQVVLPRLPASARALVAQHRDASHTLVLSTATNRVITALTAAASDSANDLPLLRAVGHPVVVDPDIRLLAEAQALGWPVLRLDRPS
ncbi:MAG: haloacid dehalogenase-like hydrolase [Aquabacterium sp.]|nr:haloacid dehalogenase-like hydrolase [Aquabacterium sp.]